MKTKRWMILYSVIVLILVLCVFIPNFFNDKPAPIGVVNNYSEIPQTSIIKINMSELTIGKSIEASKSQIVQIQLNNENYFFEIKSLDHDLQKLSILFDNSQDYTINLNREEKINLDGDRFYDIEIRLDSISKDKAKLYVLFIREELSISDLFDLRVKNIISRSNEPTTFQIASLVLLLVLIGIIIVYLIMLRLIPWIRLKNRTSSENPENVFRYILEELSEARKKGKKENVRKLFAKLKNFYKYLPKNERRRYAKEIRDIENYIN